LFSIDSVADPLAPIRDIFPPVDSPDPRDVPL
jgi:hypothetical protein